MNIQLTVAIPTYNRNEILKANLAKLIPQLTSACELVILDNCSIEPVEITLKDILATAQNVNIRIIRHRANMGVCENIFRCIEYAQGEFVWLLGDDDTPVDSAVSNIFQELDEHPDALLLNMYAPCPEHALRTDTMVVTGSIGYLSIARLFPNDFIFISSMVLKVSHAIGHMAVAHLWQSSLAPQLIMAVMMLRPNGKAVISSRRVVNSGTMTTPIENQNSIITLALGFPILLLCPWNEEEMKHIVSLVKTARKRWITPMGVMSQLVVLANQDNFGSRRLALRYYNLLLNNFFAIGHPFSIDRMLFICAWPLVALPKFGLKIKSATWRVVKGTVYDNSKHHDYHRL